MDYNKLVSVIANFYSCTEIVALGTLLGLLKGKGALDSRLVDLEISMNGDDSLFEPVRNSYYEAHSMVDVPLSLTMETANTFEIERLRKALEVPSLENTAE